MADIEDRMEDVDFIIDEPTEKQLQRMRDLGFIPPVTIEKTQQKFPQLFRGR